MERAITEGGCKTVLIYGNSLDKEYFDREIEPLLNDGINGALTVVYMGMELDRQKIYDSISCVYQSNSDKLPEAFGRVRAECIRSGIPYHGNENATTEFELWDEDKIFDAWKEFLEL